MISNVQRSVSDWQWDLQEAPTVHQGVWRYVTVLTSQCDQSDSTFYMWLYSSEGMWPGQLHKEGGGTVTRYVVIHPLRGRLRQTVEATLDSFHTEIWIHHQVSTLMSKMRKHLMNNNHKNFFYQIWILLAAAYYSKRSKHFQSEVKSGDMSVLWL